jgi:hypothetical protein
VIVPKEGESYEDTVKRAVARGKQNPDALRADIAKESTASNLASKSAETLGAAAGIGVAGPALLAAPGEAVSAIKAIPGATEAILQHLETHAAEYMSKYPSLISLAAKLGIPTTVGGVLLYLAKDRK